MNTAVVLLVAVSTVCAIARPPGPTMAPAIARLTAPQDERPQPSPKHLAREYLPHYYRYGESPRLPLPPPASNSDWVNKEIARLNQMEEEVDSIPYENIPRWLPLESRVNGYHETSLRRLNYLPKPLELNNKNLELLQPLALKVPEPEFADMIHRPIAKNDVYRPMTVYDDRRTRFALTPFDKGYYDPIPQPIIEGKVTYISPLAEFSSIRNSMMLNSLLMEPRQIRQNPTGSKARTLVGDLKSGLKARLADKSFQIPVSLLPTNRRWLKLDHPDDAEQSGEGEKNNENGKGVAKMPNHIPSPVEAANPEETVYGIALIAAIGAALTVTILGFAFAWYTLSKKAKAAADVDYPAYGVTGPTMDMSGDRKLAHSAHMYHYQHQKQQIIAMERNELGQRTGSVSDPESEEENAEGDYTVYECPGFATTGDMEVKNPLFSDDPTPATPGKCELVKQQPKE